MAYAAINNELAALRPRVERLAIRYSRQADFDDLVQEGWIACWQALEKGVHPTNEIIEGRMKNWLSYVRRQDGSSYEKIMEVTCTTQEK